MPESENKDRTFSLPPKPSRTIAIVLADFAIALFSFWLTRYFGHLPKWYWLMLSAAIWTGLGFATGKLAFDKYRRVRYAIFGIFIVNLIIAILALFLYHFLEPSHPWDSTIFWTAGFITFLEWMLYTFLRFFVYRKMDFFYEEPETEGVDAEDLSKPEAIEAESVRNVDVERLQEAVRECRSVDEVLSWIKDNRKTFSSKTILIDTAEPEALLQFVNTQPSMIVLMRPLNRVRHINTLLSYANYCIKNGGYIWCHMQTWQDRKKEILDENPFIIRYVVYFFEYLWHRVCPQLSLMNRIYCHLTKGKKRALFKVSVMGRIYRAGFDITDTNNQGGEYYITATKIKEPIRDDTPSTGLLIRLRRIGYGGKVIGVYKMRTMYPYSEYLQPYIYKHNDLAAGGKFADDFRVTRNGKFLRKTWLDELPMIVNWLRGDLKLVGVRPLSQHYYNLYPVELQQLRILVKPGLIPPYYADMPTTLEEIEASETKYLKTYIEHPHATDWKYFWKCTWNIVFKGKRSK